MEKLRGKIKWFDKVKGYGFIVNELGEDVFFHHETLEDDEHKKLVDGEAVEYHQVRYERGLKAVEVSRLKGPDAE